MTDRRAFIAPATGLLGFVFLVLSSCGGSDTPEPDGGDGVQEKRITPYYDRVAEDIDQLKNLLRAKPDDANLRAQLGRKLLEGGITDAGEAQLKTALKYDPALAEASILLFDNALSRHEVDEAARIVDQGLAAEDCASLRVAEGRLILFMSPDEVLRAREAFQKALDLDSRSADAAYQLGCLLLRQGESGEAVILLERAIALKPNHLGAHFNLVRALTSESDVEKAEMVSATHRRLSYLDDLGYLDRHNSLDAHIALGQMLIDGGDVDGGMSELSEAVRQFPREPRSWTQKAMALIRMGREGEGRSIFQQGLKTIPNSAVILNQYAWHLATQSGLPQTDRKKGLRYAERAVSATDRQNTNFLDTLAETRAALGDDRGALSALAEALRLKPEDPVLLERYAMFEGRLKGGR